MTTTAAAAAEPFRLPDILRTLAAPLEAPVIVVLIICAGGAVLLLGWMIGEYFTERRHLKVSLPRLLDELQGGAAPAEECIARSGLLRRQKEALLELSAHPGFSAQTREALAVRLMEQEQARYDGILRWSELIARLGPMFGLLGTLIPLGPGIIALGQGDTYTLSNSLLTAFDTTITGLVSAAAATVVSSVRRAWYKDYMSILETAAESVLEKENQRGRAGDGKEADGKTEE
ncbi:MAG: MotA/TolQ/ExbB proton channel family protein [Peptococcaceae bacterium]|nr:MotA/TolQ/ExbB proton channel family protein [Peptococcaceae bacterium]